ncbi:MAG: hypothetical protein JKY34_05835, partial [Kordiimonadaceae bacterium]|nr:hypothetical protein [Kordiimonadaceae bacterium]
MQTTLIHIAFWVLVQLVPLVVVWATYKITPDQKITVNGPLGGLSFKAVGAMAAWILTVTFMTNNTDSVYAFLAEENQSKLKKWTIEGQIILVDKEGRHISGHNMIDSDKVVLTMRPASRVIGADGKLELKVAGEDMPNLDGFFISYGEDPSGRPLAY